MQVADSFPKKYQKAVTSLTKMIDANEGNIVLYPYASKSTSWVLQTTTVPTRLRFKEVSPKQGSIGIVGIFPLLRALDTKNARLFLVVGKKKRPVTFDELLKGSTRF